MNVFENWRLKTTTTVRSIVTEPYTLLVHSWRYCVPSLAAASDLMLYSPGLLLLLVTVEHKLDFGCARALPLMRTTVTFNISVAPTAEKL